MPSLSSFASGSVVYTEDFGTGIASITGGVLTIDGALDPLDDRIHTIDCSSSGGIRSTSGASGTLRATSGRTLNIIERSNANRFGADNGKQSNSNGSNSRFAGNATNTLVYEAINWTIEAGGRTDFDFGAGTNSNGSLGTGVTMRGVFVNIEAETGGANNNFPHLWSQNTKLEVHPDLGYGLRIANYTQSHGLLIEVQPNAQFAGLVIDDISSVASGGGRVVCSPPDNTTYTLFNLNTPDITESNNTSTGKTILVDPVGVPTRSNNWDGYNSTMEIQRTINFALSGATDATGTLVALHQNSHAQAADATGSINAAGAGSVRVITNYSAYQAVNGAWASTDGFQFYATGYGFRKYYSGTTTINVGNAPATRNVSVTADVLPDGTAITAYTGTNGADTASEIYRIIKGHELANPTHRTLGSSLATIDASGNIVVDSTVSLQVSTTQTPLSAWAANTSTLTIKVVTGITADAGINSLNFGNRTLPAVQVAYFDMPITTSAGTSAIIRVTAPASYRVGVFGSDGTNHGNNDYSSAGVHSFLLTAAATGTGTRLGLGRAGYDDADTTIDTSAGGVFDYTFAATSQQLDALGNALYDSSLSTTGIGIEFTATGQPTWLIPDAAVSVKQLYKVFHDTYATTAGTRFAAFGRQQPGILDLGGAIPNSLFLGADAQLRRSTNSGNDAAVRAVVFGGRGGNRVMGDRGDISLVEQVGGGGGGSTDLTEVNAKLDTLQASADTLQEQNEHLATSLPLSFHDPLSPLCIVTGLEGQEIIRDTEETDWPLTASGIAGDGDPEAHGVVEFDGNNSHLDYSLNRAAQGQPVDLYTTDIIVLMQIRPTSFPAAGQRPLANIGALTLSLNNSTGTTAALHLGAGPGATTTTAQVNLNAWNDLVFVFTQNSARPNNPRIRVSINGAAQETGNLGGSSTLGDNIFGPIASNTQNFRLGGHGTGSQTSGFQGQARAIFVHPDNEVFGSDGWDIPTGVYWNSANQLWQGAQLMDRVEGIAVDSIERKIDTIEEKTYTSDELGLFPWRAATSNLTSASGSIGKLLAERRNPDTSSTIAAAVRDVTNSSPASGSLGAAINAIPTTAAPSAATIATAVENELTIPSAADNATATWSATTSANNTTGSMGHRLQETSTHGEPADSPAATDVAQAVRDISLTGAASGSLGEHLAGLSNGPTAATIRDAINNQVIFGGVSRLQKEQRELTRDQGTFAIVNGRITFTPHNAAGPTIAADLADAVRGPSTITEGS